MALTDSQVLGVLRRLRDDQIALAHSRDVLEAYMQAKEGLSQFEITKANLQKELRELAAERDKETEKRGKDREQHKHEMAQLAQQKLDRQNELKALENDVGAAQKLIEEAEGQRKAVMAKMDQEVGERERVLARISGEIEAFKKRLGFSA